VNESTDTNGGDPRPQSHNADAAEIQVLQQEKAKLEEQLQRTLADAQNMRRRAQKEAEDARRRILEGFTQELLPVLDNFQLALQA
jgi:molecular chaperone GrpE